MYKATKLFLSLTIVWFLGVNTAGRCCAEEDADFTHEKCILCDIVEGGIDVQGRVPYVLYQNESFIATVDVGSMVEGYALITSKRHINSMGELSDKEYTDFVEVQNVITNGFEKIYSKKCVCFEHGSGQNNKGIAASSVKHAHFHMVAIDGFNEDIHKKITNDLELTTIENQRDLKEYISEPYIYYIAADGVQYISKKQGFESQYMRKRIAEQFDKQYNWKDSQTRGSFKENVVATEEKWKAYCE